MVVVRELSNRKHTQATISQYAQLNFRKLSNSPFRRDVRTRCSILFRSKLPTKANDKVWNLDRFLGKNEIGKFFCCSQSRCQKQAKRRRFLITPLERPDRVLDELLKETFTSLKEVCFLKVSQLPVDQDKSSYSTLHFNIKTFSGKKVISIKNISRYDLLSLVNEPRKSQTPDIIIQRSNNPGLVF